MANSTTLCLSSVIAIYGSDAAARFDSAAAADEPKVKGMWSTAPPYVPTAATERTLYWYEFWIGVVVDNFLLAAIIMPFKRHIGAQTETGYQCSADHSQCSHPPCPPRSIAADHHQVSGKGSRLRFRDLHACVHFYPLFLSTSLFHPPTRKLAQSSPKQTGSPVARASQRPGWSAAHGSGCKYCSCTYCA